MNDANFKYTLLIASLWLFLQGAGYGQQNQVCITVDDLPATSGTLSEAEYITEKLTAYFEGQGIPAIGFVNEGKLYTNSIVDKRQIALLEKWLQRDLDLGNHTFSHIFINSASLNEYKEDIIRGEVILRPLLKKYTKELIYFRHTQLRTGPTDEYRLGLDQFILDHGYTMAPVTMDNDEYIYAYCYSKAKERGDQLMMTKIGKDYLDYMSGIIQYYEHLSLTYLGYELPQILLIHANSLNADYMEELVRLFKNRKYHFVSLAEALQDKAYEKPVGTHKRGPSWIHRWMMYDGQSPQGQPPVSSFINTLFINYRQ